jgi:hypothetical protein
MRTRHDPHYARAQSAAALKSRKCSPRLAWLAAVTGCLALVLASCQAAAPTPLAPATLRLAPGMQIGVVQTTLFGLVHSTRVDPDKPGGGTLVTVREVQPGQAITIDWRRTVEREAASEGPTPVVGVGTPAPTPVKVIVPEAGTIAATGLGSAHSAWLPIFWEHPGAESTDTSLMWLSTEALRELKSTRRTRWSPDVMTSLSLLPVVALDRIRAETEGREFTLTAKPDFVNVEVSVNGQPAILQAIAADDDFGNEYVILADEGNPLIVGFTFNVVSTGTFVVDAAVWTLIKSLYSGYQVVEIRTP